MPRDPREQPPRPCPDAESAKGATPAYGRRPETREAICAFASKVESLVGSLPRNEVAAAVAKEMDGLLGLEDLLADAHCACQPETYRRHVLYADPDGRFTILALVWRPGHGTPIHGHRNWGVVGVYEGEPNVALYDTVRDDSGAYTATLREDQRCTPGQTTFVQAGYGDAHRIYNATDARVLTIHVYGRDLVEDPSSINLPIPA